MAGPCLTLTSNTPGSRYGERPTRWCWAESSEGLTAASPQLAKVPGYETFADQMTACRSASRPGRSMSRWSGRHPNPGRPVQQCDQPQGQAQRQPDREPRRRAGPRASFVRARRRGPVRSQSLPVATGPRIFDDVGPVPLKLVAATTSPSGIVRLSYRLGPAQPYLPAPPLTCPLPPPPSPPLLPPSPPPPPSLPLPSFLPPPSPLHPPPPPAAEECLRNSVRSMLPTS